MVFACRAMKGIVPIMCLGCAVSAAGQEPARPAPADSQAGLARLAEALLGKNGGNQLFYFPTRDEPATPKTWGYRFEEVAFKSKDGTALTGWFVPAQGRHQGKAKATMVFSHGNAGSMGHHLGFCMWLVTEGYNVFLYDYRGYGKSAGMVNRRGIIDDVRAAFEAAAKHPGAGSRLVAMGHSLGGAKSIVALAEAPVRGLRAVVTDAAFSSYQAMARKIAGETGVRLVSDELAPKDFVGKLAPVPLLVVHGTDDAVVPFAHGTELFAAAKEPKAMFAVQGGGHGNALTFNGDEHRRKLLQWLDSRLK
jgi:hypothetical protein